MVKITRTVIPNRWHLPTRIYKFYEDGTVMCFAISSISGSFVDTQYEKGAELFRLSMRPEHAALLGEDLCYGEYTGA